MQTEQNRVSHIQLYMYGLKYICRVYTMKQKDAYTRWARVWCAISPLATERQDRPSWPYWIAFSFIYIYIDQGCTTFSPKGHIASSKETSRFAKYVVIYYSTYIRSKIKPTCSLLMIKDRRNWQEQSSCARVKLSTSCHTSKNCSLRPIPGWFLVV